MIQIPWAITFGIFLRFQKCKKAKNINLIFAIVQGQNPFIQE